MSIQSEIERISTQRDNISTVLRTKSVSVPTNARIDDLPALIESIDAFNRSVSFSVDSNNHLIMSYTYGTPPNLSINSQGHLILSY